MRLEAIAIILGLAGCLARPSSDGISYRCDVAAPRCPDEQSCVNGRCVVAMDANPGDVDAASPPDADPLAACRVAAGYTFEAAPNGYYRVVTTGVSWQAALADCADDVPDKSHLIVLSNPAEVTFMESKLGWVGFSDLETEGVFKTVTGEPSPPPNMPPWATGQPNNTGGTEHCGEMKSDGGLGLNDEDCPTLNPYVCECDGRPSTP